MEKSAAQFSSQDVGQRNSGRLSENYERSPVSHSQNKTRHGWRENIVDLL